MRPLMLVFTILSLSVSTGCTTTRIYHLGPAFDREPSPADLEAYVRYSKSGLARLSGQAFLKTVGGEVRYAAGSTVLLDPSTQFSEAYFAARGNDIAVFSFTPESEPFLRARRTTTADAEGRFHFDNLPPGTYVVSTVVTWWVTRGLFAGQQGGVLMETVSIGEREQKELIMSHQ